MTGGPPRPVEAKGVRRSIPRHQLIQPGDLVFMEAVLDVGEIGLRVETAEMAIFKNINTFCNPRRQQSAFGWGKPLGPRKNGRLNDH